MKHTSLGWSTFPILFFLLSNSAPAADPVAVDRQAHHLRNGSQREWDDFPAHPESDRYQWSFQVDDPAHERALLIRQRDVKQVWKISVNERAVGQLTQDENDLMLAARLLPEHLLLGRNVLQIKSDGNAVDDIEIGAVEVYRQPLDELLRESTVEVEVRDEQSGELIPCRITLITADGALAAMDVPHDERLAVRTGVIYSLTGRATIRVRGGQYKLYAGRGFEYGLFQQDVELEHGKTAQVTARIRRQVPTPQYVATDTHVHTLTFSGHGDATMAERMATLAGEGIEVPIATDHNLHVDYQAISQKLGARQYFTPIIGNEVTTPVGHFNIFPVPADAHPPNHQLNSWPELFAEIFAVRGAQVVILNHARDLHSGVRPFGPSWHNWIAGENLAGWEMRFNGMEVINSGATQNDVLELTRDWMALLNRGLPVTPVGSSDSHDVARHFVGQGRTYIECADDRPDAIDVQAAIESFLAGRVVVSYGLFTELRVNQQRPGSLVSPTGELNVNLRVLAPAWIQADHIALYANGQLIREQQIPATTDSPDAAVKWSGTWTLPCPAHDVHLVAVATGPGIDEPYWRTAKPYQPTSTAFQPRVMSCTGPVWIDADGDHLPTAARVYAERELQQSAGDLARLINNLAEYDAAVAVQAAHLWISKNGPATAEQEQLWLSGADATANGYRQYLEVWRQTTLAPQR